MAQNGIAPIAPGMTEQSIAATGAMVLTAADRDIIKGRVGEIDRGKKFTDLVREMIGKNREIDGVETGDKQNMAQEDFTTRVKIEKKLIRLSPAGEPRERVAVSDEGHEASREIDADRFSKAEEPLDEYAVLYGQKLLGLPVPEERLKEIESRISGENLVRIRGEAEKALSALLSLAVKESIGEGLKSARFISNLVMRVKRPGEVLDFYSGTAAIGLKDLIDLVRQFGYTDEDLLSLYNMETVTLSKDALLVKELELKKKHEAAGLEERYTDLVVSILLCDNSIERYKLFVSAGSVKGKLESLGTDKIRIAQLTFEGKKIAWLKSVVMLKELHLKRVLSDSRGDFESLSSQINSHTLRARKLGLRISREGVKWIEAKLENMALDAANYKINLLKSMQSLSNDAEREKEIAWLELKIERLEHS